MSKMLPRWGLAVALGSLLGALLLLFLFLAMPDVARAQDCRSQKTTQDSEACAKARLEEASRGLQKAYDTYMSALPEGRTHELLGKAQEAWVRFRQADCQLFASMYEGGTIQGTEFLICEERMTKDRLDDLKRILDPPGLVLILPPRD